MKIKVGIQEILKEQYSISDLKDTQFLQRTSPEGPDIDFDKVDWDKISVAAEKKQKKINQSLEWLRTSTVDGKNISRAAITLSLSALDDDDIKTLSATSNDVNAYAGAVSRIATKKADFLNNTMGIDNIVAAAEAAALIAAGVKEGGVTLGVLEKLAVKYAPSIAKFFMPGSAVEVGKLRVFLNGYVATALGLGLGIAGWYAESGLTELNDSEIEVVLMDLRPLFQATLPKSKKELADVIKSQDSFIFHVGGEADFRSFAEAIAEAHKKSSPYPRVLNVPNWPSVLPALKVAFKIFEKYRDRKRGISTLFKGYDYVAREPSVISKSDHPEIFGKDLLYVLESLQEKIPNMGGPSSGAREAKDLVKQIYAGFNAVKSVFDRRPGGALMPKSLDEKFERESKLKIKVNIGDLKEIKNRESERPLNEISFGPIKRFGEKIGGLWAELVTGIPRASRHAEPVRLGGRTIQVAKELNFDRVENLLEKIFRADPNAGQKLIDDLAGGIKNAGDQLGFIKYTDPAGSGREIHFVFTQRGLEGFGSTQDTAEAMAKTSISAAVSRTGRAVIREPMDPDAWYKRVVEEFEKQKYRGKDILGLQAAELVKIAKETGFVPGSAANPFPSYEVAVRFYEGKMGTGLSATLTDLSKKRSKKYEALDLWFPIKTGEGPDDYAFIGTPAKIKAGQPDDVLGYVDGKLTLTRSMGVGADDFVKGWKTSVSNLQNKAYRVVRLGFSEQSRIGNVLEWANAPIRGISFWSRVYIPTKAIDLKLAEISVRLQNYLLAAEMLTGSIATRAIEFFILSLIKETGLIRESSVVGAVKFFRYLRACAAGSLMVWYAIELSYRAQDAFFGVEATYRDALERYRIQPSEENERLVKAREKELIEGGREFARKHGDPADADTINTVSQAVDYMKKTKSDFDKAGEFLGMVTDPGGWITEEENWYSTSPVDAFIIGYKKFQGPLANRKEDLEILSREALSKGEDAGKKIQDLYKDVTQVKVTDTPASKKTKTPLEQSGLSKKDFAEWRGKVSEDDYKSWRKSGDTVEGWESDQVYEHNDLGSIIENYIGNNIIKNIKIGSKTGPRSGDKK